MSGLPSNPGSVFGTGAWISGSGPRSGALRRPPRGAAAGAVLDTVTEVAGVAMAAECVAGDGLPSAAAADMWALPASEVKMAKRVNEEVFTRR